MEDLISVIIPAYNAEKRIEKCLDSVVSQDGVYLEILIIDDGSTDETAVICKNYEKKYSFCRVIRQENRGVSASRNIGVDQCRGRWIVFVDADDELAPGTLRNVYHIAKTKHCDTVCWNGVYQKENGRQRMNPFCLPTKQIEKSNMHILWESLYYLTTDEVYTGDYFRACWGKLLSADLIRKSKLRFPENMKIGEDAIFLFSYFHLCQNVWMEDSCWYYYFISNNSATGRYRVSLSAEQHLEYKMVSYLFRKYNENIVQMSIRFWHLAYLDFLQNEQKSGESCLTQVKRGNAYIKDATVKRYLRKFDGRKTGSAVRTLLILIGLGKLVVLLDIFKLHRKVV